MLKNEVNKKDLIFTIETEADIHEEDMQLCWKTTDTNRRKKLDWTARKTGNFEHDKADLDTIDYFKDDLELLYGELESI